MPDAPRVLVIDGNTELSDELAARLESERFKLQLARNRIQAGSLLRELRFDAILIDVKLPDGDGEECYRDASRYLGSTPVIFMTTAGEVEQAVRLLKAGAFDCVEKPCNIANLVTRLRAALERQLPRDRSWPDPILISPPMRELGQRLLRLAGSNISLIVTGESGCGKEVIARYLHRLSPRASEPFIEIAGASLAGEEGERSLFGEYVRPIEDRTFHVKPGVLEEVGRGTLFFKEIEDLAPSLQSRLAQVMDDGRFRRIGDVGSLPFEGRIVAATELSLADLREKLRPNLFSRLAVVDIEVPPLRDRRQDLVPLVDSVSHQLASELDLPIRPIDAEAMSALAAHDWPGNVRELHNRLLRAFSFARGDKIGVEDFFPDVRLDESVAAPMPTLEKVRSDAERQRIMDALAANEGRIGNTARSLGISRVTLWGKMKRLGISGGAEALIQARRKSSDGFGK
jgi:DNA-binding NtrC family response regulator